MVGAALHHDVARAEGHLGVVEDQRDLALEHDAVVDGCRPVHRGLQPALVQEPGPELVDPDLRAQRRRGTASSRSVGSTSSTAVSRVRGSCRVPDLVERHAVLWDLAADRHRPVGHDDRDAVGSVAGDDAAGDRAHDSSQAPGDGAGQDSAASATGMAGIRLTPGGVRCFDGASVQHGPWSVCPVSQRDRLTIQVPERPATGAPYGVVPADPRGALGMQFRTSPVSPSEPEPPPGRPGCRGHLAFNYLP